MHRIPLSIALLLASAHVAAQVPATRSVNTEATTASAVPNDRAVDLATITVSGAQPGPPLWMVRKGTHTLWILGTLSPLPRDMTFESREVAGVIAQSQELVDAPSVVVGSGTGFFGTMMLVPAALKARNNPDDKRLEDILPPATYARWTRLKAKHIGRDGGIEKRRPIIAAQELYSEAIDEMELGGKPIVMPVINDLAKKAGVKRTTPRIKHTIQAPKQALKDAAKVSFDDAVCFDRLLDVVETGLPVMRARANAWATGDVESLRAMPLPDAMNTCWNAYAASALGDKYGVKDLPQRARADWLKAVESALERNTSTFALVPIGDLLDRSLLLAKLEAKGYEVVEP